MRKIIIIFSVVVSTLSAQNFIGTITYSITDTGEAMELFAPYVPSRFRIYFNQSQVALDFQGGIFDGVRFTFPPNKKEAAIIIDSLKIYTTVGEEEAKGRKKLVEKLPETEKILGHICTKYKVYDDDSVYKNAYYVWIASDISIPSSVILQEAGQDFFVKDIPYAVLKIESSVGLHYEATSILNLTPNPAIFKIPKGFKLEKRLFRKAEEKEKK